MIPVQPAPEPPDFDAKVRIPGLRAVAELVGECPEGTRCGPPRAPVAARREDIPPDRYPPFWRAALGDLLTAYNRICAYTCLYIYPVTGGPSVDHIQPVSQNWDKVYEWGNYRLACALTNSRKGVVADVLDPFEVKSGWFELEFTGFQVLAGRDLDGPTRERVDRTISRLALNDYDCRRAREEYAVEYQRGHISLDFLVRHAPFVAQELCRQVLLHET